MMYRRFYLCFSFLTIGFIFSSQSIIAQGYEIKVKLEDYTKNSLYLAYRLGTQTYIADTITGKNNEGLFVFEGDTAKHPGIYLVVTEGDNYYFEFLIPDKQQQQFTLMAKNGKEMSNNWSVAGSPANEDFIKYRTLIKEKSAEMEKLKAQKPADAAAKDKQAAEEKAIIQSVTAYEAGFTKLNPGKLLTNIIMAGKDPEVPKAIQLKGEKASYFYYRSHFWDKVDLADNRLLYSSVISDKVEKYTEKLTVQNPDSLIKAVDEILGRVKKAGDPEVYQSVLIQLFNKYARSKMVCFDKVYLHIGSVYYCGKSSPPWIQKEELDEIRSRLDDLRLSACGSKAQPINLPDAGSEARIQLSDINAPLTVVFFWWPEAIASEKELEELFKTYKAWNKKGLEVLAVSMGSSQKTKSIVDTKAITWKNVTVEEKTRLSIQKDYGISQFPTLYLLDKEKKIMYKKIDVKQLNEILGDLFK